MNVYPVQGSVFHPQDPMAGKNRQIFSSQEIYKRVNGFPGGSGVKNPPANAGDMGSIPSWGRSPGEGKGKPLQYSCLGNPMYKGVRWAHKGPWGHKESDTTERAHTHRHTQTDLSVLR